MSYFSERHSVRSYDNTKAIGKTLIDSIIEQAMHAPNTGNMQLSA